MGEKGKIAMVNRDTFRYELHQGNTVVYVGITNNPERRMAEHQANKDFGSMVLKGPAVSRATAEKWEESRIATYKRNHGGERPIYNQNDTGK